MSILVTGLSGFVGSHIAADLYPLPLALDGEPVDIRDADAVRAAVDLVRPQAVLHLAAQSSVRASFDDPAQTQQINFLGTLNLLNALRDTGFAGRFLFASSGDIYGLVQEGELPITEAQPARPRSPYAVSKAATELLCYQWSQTGPFDVLVARPFNHIGPRQSTQFAVSDFARQIARAHLCKAPPVLTVGDIDATRDFTDVRDVVHAYMRILKDGISGKTYNICSGVERSLRSIIEQMSQMIGIPVQCTVDAARLRPAEQRRVRGSYEQLQRDTGWQPGIEFAQTLGDMIEYWEREETQ